MKRIRSGRGLGDNIYLHCIVRHLVDAGEKLQVCTPFPELFPFAVKFAPWSRVDIDYTCHYVHNKHDLSSTQFQDMCTRAGLQGVAYRARWQIRNPTMVESVLARAAGKRLLIVNAGRQPMDRADGFGRELLPDEAAFNRALARMRRDFYAVYVGRGSRFWAPRVDLDLNDLTQVAEVMDLASVAAAGFTQCGFVIPLMECFGKPMMIMLTGRALRAKEKFIRQLVPEKLCGQPTSTHVFDDWPAERIDTAVDAFCRSARGGGEVSGQVGRPGR